MKKNRLFTSSIMLFFLLICIGCSDDDSGTPVNSSMSAFGFTASDNSGLSVDVSGVFDGTNIIVVLPSGTDRSALVANFIYSGRSISVGDTAQTSGSTENDFSGPLAYTITGDNPASITYSVKVLSWESLGAVSDSAAFVPGLAVDSNNRPVVSYNPSNTMEIYAKHWVSGTSWSDLGKINTTGGWAADVIINPVNNHPLFLHKDFGSLKINEWDGSSWTLQLSSGSMMGNADYFQFRYNPHDDKYWLVFEQYMTNDRAQVSRIEDASSFTNFGHLGGGGTQYNSLAIDDSGQVVVVFCDQTNGTNVMAYRLENETNWVSFGSVSGGPAAFSRVEIDQNDALPVVAYADLNDSGRAKAKKWSAGTTWSDMGNIGSGNAIDIKTAVDPSDGRFLVSYQGASGQIQVFRWGGGSSWNSLSFPYSGTNAVIACGSDGLPVVALSDSANAGKVVVYKLK